MRYPKIVTFRLFGYILDIMLDKEGHKNERIDQMVKDLEDWSDSLGELEPVEENVIADYEPTYPAVETMKAIKKPAKKPVKKVTKKPVKKAPRKR